MKTLTTLVLSALLTVGCSMTGQVQADDDYFSQAELDSMLAPVALYPDSVLSHVLIAATYPLEVIQAARWSREHPGLRGEDAVAAVEHRNWDASVKALVAFPDLLARMDEDLEWTQRLGDAFLMQEEEVIASIQYLRSEAYSNGHLASNDRVKVVREKEYIYIEPARTRVVYVPYYDPRVVYSSWRWSGHSPYYWHRPSGFNVSIGFHWGRPYYVQPNFYFSSVHWAQRRVVVVNHHHHYYRDHGFHSGRQVARFEQARHWKHDPTHRRGVSYRGRVEQTRFVNNNRPASARVASGNTSRAVVRSEKREWAAERRAGNTGFDRQAQSRARASSRTERAVESRGSDRAAARVQNRDGSSSRVAERSSNRATSSQSRERGRTVTGRAPESAATRGRSSESARSSADRSGRITESLRSGSNSRAEVRSRSRGAERSTGISNRSESGRSSSPRASSSDRKSPSVSIPSERNGRSSSTRERSSAPSRSTRSSEPSRSTRSSAPSRQSAPSRSRSGSRESAPSRATPRVRSSAPSRQSSPSTPSRSSQSSAPSRSSKPSAPSRSSRSAPSRSAKSSSPSRSRGSAPSRSRGGSDSRRGGRGGEERR